MDFGIDPAHFYIDLIGFRDWIVFGGFLGIPFGLPMDMSFIFMWGIIVVYVSFGLFRDFGYSIPSLFTVSPRVWG